MTREIGHFVGGQLVAGTGRRFADVYNPSTGAAQAKVALATKAKLRTLKLLGLARQDARLEDSLKRKFAAA